MLVTQLTIFVIEALTVPHRLFLPVISGFDVLDRVWLSTLVKSGKEKVNCVNSPVMNPVRRTKYVGAPTQIDKSFVVMF